MTEQEWLDCTDPMALVNCWGPSARKLRLYACACVRRIWHLIPDARSRTGVEVSEAFADEPRLILDLLDAHQEAAEALSAALRSRDRASLAYQLHFLEDVPGNEGDLSADDGYHAYAALMAASDAVLAARVAAWSAAQSLCYSSMNSQFQSLRRLIETSRMGSSASEQEAQARLLREIAGNPFRKVRVPGTWLVWGDGVVWRLAQAIYDEGAFDRLPILGDALEDAGCLDQQILEHCRRPATHVRGCFVIDGLLGKG